MATNVRAIAASLFFGALALLVAALVVSAILVFRQL